MPQKDLTGTVFRNHIGWWAIVLGPYKYAGRWVVWWFKTHQRSDVHHLDIEYYLYGEPGEGFLDWTSRTGREL